jgi:3-phenylpropionate/trans-cinnamate dioxygenase ferredoxin reductase subunit
MLARKLLANGVHLSARDAEDPAFDLKGAVQ